MLALLRLFRIGPGKRCLPYYDYSYWIGQAIVEFTHLGSRFREVREPSGMVVVWQLPEEGSHALYHAIFARNSPFSDRRSGLIRPVADRRRPQVWGFAAHGGSMASSSDRGDCVITS